MDRRIRELQRRAASGDYDAEIELEAILDRFRRDEYEHAKENLLNTPGDLATWAKYIAASHALRIDPQIGDPYYRTLRRDLKEIMIDIDEVGRRYARHDGSYNYHDFMGRYGSAYLDISHPNYHGDRAKFGMVISLLHGGYRVFGKIFRDGSIKFWVVSTQDQFYDKLLEGSTPNTFTAANDLINFLWQQISDI